MFSTVIDATEFRKKILKFLLNESIRTENRGNRPMRKRCDFPEQGGNDAIFQTKAEAARRSRPRRRRRNFPNTYLYSCSYFRGFTKLTLFSVQSKHASWNWWSLRNKFMLRPCSTHDSTLFDSWFDPVRLTIRPCSTYDSTLLDSWFDLVRLMIRPCLTHDSTLFDS